MNDDEKQVRTLPKPREKFLRVLPLLGDDYIARECRVVGSGYLYVGAFVFGFSLIWMLWEIWMGRGDDPIDGLRFFAFWGFEMGLISMILGGSAATGSSFMLIARAVAYLSPFSFPFVLHDIGELTFLRGVLIVSISIMILCPCSVIESIWGDH